MLTSGRHGKSGLDAAEEEIDKCANAIHRWSSGYFPWGNSVQGLHMGKGTQGFSPNCSPAECKVMWSLPT
jgi:hypothetical protein